MRLKSKLGKKLHIDDDNVELDTREKTTYPEVK